MPKAYTPQDKFFRKAKKEGYRARSIYKLQEIDEKFGVFKKGMSVLDLGCAPGSWIQYLVEKTEGDIMGVDLQEVEELKGAKTFVCDAFSQDLHDLLKKENYKSFHAIISDMAPKTSGISDVDQYASVELNLEALEVARKYLKKGGWGIFKIFRGEDFNDFWLEAKKTFPKMKTFKPQACRDRSYEIYCVGKRL